MSNKNIKIFILGLFLTLSLFLTPVSAFNEDFSLFSSKKDVIANNCGTYTDIMSVINEGDVTSTYQVGISGDAAKYCALAPTRFSLEPGESKILYNYITVPCKIEGTFDADITISTLFGLKKNFERKLTVRKSPAFTITDYGLGFEACPCTPVMYKFTIQNTGSIAKSYEANVDGFHKEFVSISEKRFMLAPSDKFDLFIYVTEPCYFFGESFFDLSVSEKETGYTAVVPFYLKTKPCYDFTASINESMNVCNDEKGNYRIDIHSTSDIGNIYTLYSKDVSLDASQVFLWGRESAAVNGTFLEESAGQKNLSVSVTGERGQTTLTYASKLDVERCHSVNINFPKVSDDVAACEQKGYSLVLKNDGTKTERYNLTLLSPEWASLAFESAMELKPSESRNFFMNLDIPCDAQGRYSMKVDASISDRANIKDSASFDLNVISVDKAYRPKIYADSAKLNYETNHVNAMIKNTGALEGTYDISLDAPPWARLDLDQNKITLGPQETKSFNIVTTPGDDVVETGYMVTITASLPVSDTSYSKSIVLTMQKETLWQKARRILKDFFYNYWIYLLAGILLGLLIVGLIILYKRRQNRKKVEEKIAVERIGFAGIKTGKIRKGFNWRKIGIFGVKLLVALLALTLLALVAVNLDTIGKYGKAGISKAGSFLEIIGGKTVQVGEEIVRIAEIIKEEIPKTRSIIYINTTGLDTAGNLIRIKALERVSVPITIQNNDDVSVSYTIFPDENASWISSERQVIEIASNSSESFNINIFADKKVSDGLYEVAVEAAIKEENATRYTEGILLEIEKTTPFAEKYMYYFLTGFGLLIIIIGFLFLKDRIKSKGIIRLRKEHPLDLLADRKNKRKWMKFVFGLALVIAFISLGIYGLMNLNIGGKESRISAEISQATEKSVVVSKGDTLDVLLKNDNDYDQIFFMANNADFIEPSKNVILVLAHENKLESFDIKKGVSGFYDMNIEVTKKDKTPEYNSKIIIEYKEKQNFHIYMLAGIGAGLIILFSVMFAIKRKKAGTDSSGKKALKIDSSKPLVEEMKTESKESKDKPFKRSKELKIGKKKK